MFLVTKEWLIYNYAHINRTIYEGILPPVKFKIKKNLKLRLKVTTKNGKKKHKKCEIWAYAQKYKIVFTKKFHSEKMARDVLAHEMVHVWQTLVTSVDVHGKSFKTWKKLYLKHRLKLTETYSEKDYL